MILEKSLRVLIGLNVQRLLLQGKHLPARQAVQLGSNSPRSLKVFTVEPAVAVLGQMKAQIASKLRGFLGARLGGGGDEGLEHILEALSLLDGREGLLDEVG